MLRSSGPDECGSIKVQDPSHHLAYPAYGSEVLYTKFIYRTGSVVWTLLYWRDVLEDSHIWNNEFTNQTHHCGGVYTGRRSVVTRAEKGVDKYTEAGSS